MSLKTNSKQVRESIKDFILNNFNYDDHPGINKDFDQVKKVILNDFNNYISESDRGRALSAIFFDWSSGLPSTLSFDDIYLGSEAALDTLGDILQQSEKEKANYTERDAEKLLVNLIYRELTRG